MLLDQVHTVGGGRLLRLPTSLAWGGLLGLLFRLLKCLLDDFQPTTVPRPGTLPLRLLLELLLLPEAPLLPHSLDYFRHIALNKFIVAIEL